MIGSIDIESKFSAGVLADINAGLGAVMDRALKVRLVRVPVDEFNRAIQAIIEKQAMPFQPKVFGYACEPYPIERPSIVCVADDDTNLQRFNKTEEAA